jgi:predicted transglutaminase-like cysteine proteinase
MLSAGVRALGLASLFVACAANPPAAGERTASLSPPAMGVAPAALVSMGPAREPMGWVDFCKRYEGECDVRPLEPENVVFDAKTRRLVERLNREINARISPATDAEMWGLQERWDYPQDDRGDCEDYVLLKRKTLIEMGLPRQALLVTVVTDLQGDGHAVLTLRTDRGDYILDNMADEVKLWRETPYGFVKRQSQTDPNLWVSIGQPSAGAQIVSR